MIALNRLDRILEIDPYERIAVVEAGAINLQVTAAARPLGVFYAPDPSSQAVCTIGGNVAFNSGGAHCLKHGMTSSHVLALKAVLPDGEVVRLGSRGLEPVGPGSVGLFCGSEGLFGIALEVTVRLLPLPETTRTTLATYANLEAAGEAVSMMVASRLLPVALEIMDARAIEAAEASVKPGYPRGARALLIVELEGELDVVEAEFELLREVIERSLAREVRHTDDPSERARIWRGRKAAFSAVGWLAPDYIIQDGVVPRTRLGSALREIERPQRSLWLANRERFPRRRRKPAPDRPLRRRRGAGRQDLGPLHRVSAARSPASTGSGWRSGRSSLACLPPTISR